MSAEFSLDRDDLTGRAYGARAFVVLPDLGTKGSRRDPEARLKEAVGLSKAIALDVVKSDIVRVRTPRPATMFGKGQVERLRAEVASADAALMIVDGALSALQQRNLESELGVKVIDRTGLILEIFGERAATREGRLQVELAHLQYQASRLVRSWTHLERQRGGFGFLGGPGETQIETDRRLIRDRIARLRRELETVTRTRDLQRRRRQKAPYPVVALVGYTNAGKSTLFNRLTGADVAAEDLLFATLDPTMRQIDLPGMGKVILSDTVGFVSELPTQLVAAFRATLEEVLEADIVVHVRDIAHPDSEAQAADVYDVLAELGLRRGGPVPIVEVLNKTDLMDIDSRAALANGPDRVPVSALTGAGLDVLRTALADLLLGGAEIYELRVPLAEGRRIAWLEANAQILSRSVNGADMRLRVRMPSAAKAKFDTLNVRP